MSTGLDRFQRDLLEAFFAREQRFFLTGGAALAGFYLHHRQTLDLDLFTTEDHLEDGEAALFDAAQELGATVERLRTSTNFRRFLVRRRSESVVADIVRDLAPQIDTEKPVRDGIRIDSPREIMANKLCTLLSRGELRDLVDVRALEQAGHRVEEHLELAAVLEDVGSRLEDKEAKAQLYTRLARLHLDELHNADLAREAIAQAIEILPAFIPAQLVRFDLLHTGKEFETLAQSIESFLSRPDLPDDVIKSQRKRLAQIYEQKLDNRERAVELYRETMQEPADTPPEDRDEILEELYRRQGRMAEALSAFREAHARRPLDPSLVSKLADALISTGQPAEAEQLLLAAQVKHPDNPYIVFALARVLENA